LFEVILEKIDGSEILVCFQKEMQFLSPLRRKVFWITKEVVALTFDEGALQDARLVIAASAHFIDNLIVVGDQVEFIEHNVSLWQVLKNGGFAGTAAIHSDGNNALFLRQTQTREKSFQCLFAAPLGKVE